MELRNYSIAVREVLAGASLIFLIAAGVSLYTPRAANAQAVDGDGAPAMDYVATGDGSSDGNLDVPAPAVDYDIPARPDRLPMQIQRSRPARAPIACSSFLK
jgi:hypothetical protein